MNDQTTWAPTVTALHGSGTTLALRPIPAPPSRRNLEQPFGEPTGGGQWRIWTGQAWPSPGLHAPPGFTAVVSTARAMEHVLAKYTGRHVTRLQLERAMRLGGLGAEFAMGIGSTAEAVGVIDNELIGVIDTITRHTSTVRQVIAAEPGHPNPPLSGLDELQGAGLRFDALIAVRNVQLGHLDRLLRLWQLWLSSQDVPDPVPQR